MFLVKVMNSTSHAVKARSGLIAALHKGVSVVQYVLAANVILVIIQILVISKYSILSLTFVSYVSNFLTAMLLATFALRFVTWYRNRKNSLGILLYALAFLILAVSEVVAGVGSAYILSQKDQIITPASKVEFRNFPEGTFLNSFFSYYQYIDYSSFLLTLIASALLLYHYSKKTKRPKIILILYQFLATLLQYWMRLIFTILTPIRISSPITFSNH
jgi:hypothetical protein